MKRLAFILLMLGMIAGAAIPQMTPTFTGKLYNRAWYQSVPETWASYLMQLNVGGVTKIQFNADGSATFAGNITANGVVLGAGGGASAIGDLSDWPAGVSATEVGYLDGLTGALTGLLAAKAPLAGPAFTGSPTVNGHLTISTTATTANLTVGASTVTVNDSRAALEVPAGGLVRPVAGADEAGTTLYVFSADGGEGGGATAGGALSLAAGCSRPLALDQAGIGEAQPGGMVTIESGNGGYAAGATNDNGAAGGLVSIACGQGGATATDSTGTGGAGGAVTITAGRGGNQTGANGTAGDGGDVSIKPGLPGTVGTGTPGAGGDIKFYSAGAADYTERLTLTDTAFTVTGIPLVTDSTVDGIDISTIPTTYAPIDSPTFTTGITTPAIKVTGGTPGAGKVLTSDADGDGSWTTPSVTAPAGNDNQLQYNDNGSFGAANATWDAGRFEIGTTATGATLLVHSDRSTPFTNYLISDVAAQIWPGLQFDLSAAAGVTPASGLGADMRMLMQTSTTASQPASRIETQWLDATHATRRAQLGLYVSEAHGEEVGLRIEGTSGPPNVIGGYSGNTVTAGKFGAVIGGGGWAGGANSIGGNYGVITGGYNNRIGTGPHNTILGGISNSTVGNAGENTLIGNFNSVSNAACCIRLLGDANNTDGGMAYCYALGRGNYQFHSGTVMISDGSSVSKFLSPAANSLSVRATGGIRLATAYAEMTCTPATDDFITATSHGWANGDTVQFYSAAATPNMPGGLTAGTVYYIRDAEEHKFKVEATVGGGAVDITSTGGTVKVSRTIATTIDTAGIIQPGGGYKSADGTAGMTDTRSWDDADGNTHAVTIKNGLITAWTVTPP